METLVIGLTGLSPVASEYGCPSNAGADVKCDTSQKDLLLRKIGLWFGLMVLFYLSALILLSWVRLEVDAAASAEERANKFEDDNRIAIRKDIRAARKAMQIAAEESKRKKTLEARLHADITLSKLNLLLGMEEDVKTKQGISRLADQERKKLRVALIGVLLCALGANVCASGAFFRSLDLHYGHSKWAPNLAAVTSIAVIAVPVFFVFFRVAACDD